MTHSSLSINPIALIHSGYKEKFGIPRQPGLAASMTATIELLPPFDSPDTVRGLEHCSHIWLLFVFSACVDKGWSPLVRPPRLGGNEKLGVFATRSPFRPNPVGLSPVKLDQIRKDNGKVFLDVSGADLLDQTPIIDIKPYLPYADIIPEAEFELASSIEMLDLPVHFNSAATAALLTHSNRLQQPLQQQIEEVLQCDPRPAYHKGKDNNRDYGIKLHDLNIRWQISDSRIDVTIIEKVN
ncbi:tRNA (N6-threonylcarbamoyladenosine(37)-N6)-methyltransferase TrmO [Amphritea balenae]|uniref:tRNA (N6-threonylcarbamoyladenosine(37)-N6)-methyltransferase TrmO n=1 Tax=Amphritea balenae TaxID=452629 RepID=A0A3P1SKQ7_9GAMM|nr:tRNA (N6-threonylcarbamoyladenosine(37)-N6)-methyltransferase TrmO [Amphritea balenae]RRC97580.1 tRNA (N6-threonylcarbamoyladenosine(37)-N6)-methyltransferase TrmO [Amphritea balenae]GGK73963.1 tRNA (N6-threonylcarbamoyladenosine(37)-N6)-methyltransferase TrmO [Amphritea balenae]